MLHRNWKTNGDFKTESEFLKNYFQSSYLVLIFEGIFLTNENVIALDQGNEK